MPAQADDLACIELVGDGGLCSLSGRIGIGSETEVWARGLAGAIDDTESGMDPALLG